MHVVYLKRKLRSLEIDSVAKKYDLLEKIIKTQDFLFFYTKISQSKYV